MPPRWRRRAQDLSRRRRRLRPGPCGRPRDGCPRVLGIRRAGESLRHRAATRATLSVGVMPSGARLAPRRPCQVCSTGGIEAGNAGLRAQQWQSRGEHRLRSGRESNWRCSHTREWRRKCVVVYIQMYIEAGGGPEFGRTQDLGGGCSAPREQRGRTVAHGPAASSGNGPEPGPGSSRPMQGSGMRKNRGVGQAFAGPLRRARRG